MLNAKGGGVMPKDERAAEAESEIVELRRKMDTWSRYCDVSRCGVLFFRYVWAAALALKYWRSSAGAFRAVALGALMFFKPWAAWVLRALELDAGIELDRPALLLSGVAFALSAIDDFFQRPRRRRLRPSFGR